MLCEFPILAIKKHNGKLYFLSLEDREKIENNEICLVDLLGEKFVRPSLVKEQQFLKNKLIGTYPIVKLPCRKCLLCRLESSGEWAVRCWLEATQYESNQYVTLTYSNDNLPDDGASKKELSKFMHDLRQYFQRKKSHTGIRFFGCGEYGEKDGRAHYHILLFNCPPFGDEEKYSKNSQGVILYESKILERIWGKGYCLTGEVTRETAAYVTGFTLKKIDSHSNENFNPEFRLMSRKKGIGIDYFNDNLEQIINSDEIILPDDTTAKLPNYFNRKLKEQIGSARYEIEFAKPRAEKAKKLLAEEMEKTGMTEDELTRQKIEKIKNAIDRNSKKL